MFDDHVNESHDAGIDRPGIDRPDLGWPGIDRPDLGRSVGRSVAATPGRPWPATGAVTSASDLFLAAGIDLTGVDLSLLQLDDPMVSPLAWLDPDRGDLTDNALIEMCSLACRLEAWAGSVKARGALTLRRSYQAEAEQSAAERGQRPDPDPSLAMSMAATEIGCATAHSLDQVERWIRLAHWLAQVPTAHADFTSGRLGWAKAAAFEDCAANYPAEVAEAVYRAERERAMVRSSGQMRVRWNRALAKADPDVMRERAEAAHTEREVRLLTRCSAPGMASLLLTGPAPLILTAKQRLDDIADAVRAADQGNARTLDAIRLDAALALLLHGPFGAAAPGPFRAAGSGSSGAAGSEASGPAGSEASGPAGSEASGPAGSGSSSAAPAGPRPRAGAPWVPARRPAVVVTIPLSVLTGVSQSPALLAGYGPIPAQMARELAADAVWRCAAVDDDPGSPTHAALVALGRTTYTPKYVPGEHARRFITLRDGTCRFPGCQAQAATGDLDHRIPHTRGGPTCDCNLQSLCRRHHRLKHEGGITVRRGTSVASVESALRPDAVTWTMPSGRTYTTEPDDTPF